MHRSQGTGGGGGGERSGDGEGTRDPPAQGCIRREGPQRRPQKRLDRRLEDIAKAVGGGYCRLQMPLKPALAVRATVAGHRLGALQRGGGTDRKAPLVPLMRILFC